MLADRLAGFAGSRVGQAALSGAAAAAERVSRRLESTPSLAVLTYHRVAPPGERPDLHPGLVSATPEAFDAQMAGLTRAGARPVSLADVLAHRRDGTPLPERAVLVTFDDGYADFSEHAWPVLHHHGIPVVLFVPTGFPGTERTFWWDRLHHALTSTARRDQLALAERPGEPFALSTAAERRQTFRRLRAVVKAEPHERAMALVDELVADLGVAEPAPATLSWDRLASLREEGVTLAPHSRSHALLHRVGAAQLADEVRGSVDDLRRAVGDAPPAFAFPSGGYDDQAVAAVREAGIELAFTTDRGVNPMPGADWLRLRRVNVGGRTSPALIRAQLLPVTHQLLERAANRRPVRSRKPEGNHQWN
jgi:peptidoglycan/xylan/chitin deacetylase (PgdA/CDA1 family)